MTVLLTKDSDVQTSIEIGRNWCAWVCLIPSNRCVQFHISHWIGASTQWLFVFFTKFDMSNMVLSMQTNKAEAIVNIDNTEVRLDEIDNFVAALQRESCEAQIHLFACAVFSGVA